MINLYKKIQKRGGKEMAYSTQEMMTMAAFYGMAKTYTLVAIAIYVLLIVAQWKIFEKAGEEGWKSLIPIYNMVVLFKIVGMSPWLLLIFLIAWIPFIGALAVLILVIMLDLNTAKAFGQSTAFAIGLIFLPNIFLLILGFGSAQYVGAAAR